MAGLLGTAIGITTQIAPNIGILYTLLALIPVLWDLWNYFVNKKVEEEVIRGIPALVLLGLSLFLLLAPGEGLLNLYGGIRTLVAFLLAIFGSLVVGETVSIVVINGIEYIKSITSKR